MENSQQPGNIRHLDQAYRTAYLIKGFLMHQLNREEKDELDEWILASDANMILFEVMTDEKNIEEARAWFKSMNVESDLEKTKKKIAAGKKNRFWYYAVAGVIILLVISGIYIFQRRDNSPQNKFIVDTQDIQPGSNEASLLLDNGKVIRLSPGADTMISDHVKILRGEGQVVYAASATHETAYHTLQVPRKGHYKLVLPDGTKVWLNAASSIRYPVSFSETERKVYVTGETFFEVAKDKDRPFRAVSDEITVEALGTAFNINAYSNEPFFSVALSEGSVMVTNGSQENILKPGQQARLTEKDFSISTVNIDSALGWKNNQFKFINTPIDAIMRQVERWYDADVVFQDKLSLHLNATIERDVPVSKLLQLLEKTEQVKFKVDGKKIIVMK
jgi:transmembrane sensor